MRFVFPYLARWRSANWSRYHQLLYELARRGHDVIILEPPPRSSAETNYTDYPIPLPPRVQVRELAIPPTFWQHRLPLDKLVKKGVVALFEHRDVQQVVRAEQVDALLVYNIPQAPMLTASCRVVFDIADDLVAMLDQEMGALAGFGPRQVSRRLFQWMIDRANLVTTSSSGLRQELGQRPVLVPNGFNPDEIEKADGTALRREFNGPVVGFLGAFEYFVDFELVLAAASRLPDITFLLVGGGRQWSAVRARVASLGLRNIVLPGPVPHDVGLNYVHAMDVCLIPFTRDRVSRFALPLKLFEYLALGKPVITTPGYEIERVAGAYVTLVTGPDEMVEAIRTGLDHDEGVRTRVASARALVYERYTWRAIADTFLNALAAT